MTKPNLPIYTLRLALAPLLWLLAACSGTDADAPAGGRLTLVLSISDAAPASRADGADEIQSLRIIVARPDGTVEANRLVRPGAPGDDTSRLLFDIEPDPWKTVYLVANEASTGLDTGATAAVSPAALDAPALHPADLVSLRVGDVDPAAPMPMSAVYRLATTARYARPDGYGRLVVPYELQLMRTMAQFTFTITNRRQIPVTVSSLGITGIQAPDHWLFPRVATTDGRESVHYMCAEGSYLTESGTGMPPGGSAATPGTDYFRDRYLASCTGYGSRTFIEGELVVAPQEATTALTFRHTESAPPADADPAAPYTLYIEFDGNTYTCPLDNLPSLPRNTHVQVLITFTSTDKLIEVEVLPYIGVDLNPGFGQTQP